jgi:hypothetical protein
MLHEYHVTYIYSVWYYPRFHVTVGTYYPLQVHCCTFHERECVAVTQILQLLFYRKWSLGFARLVSNTYISSMDEMLIIQCQTYGTYAYLLLPIALRPFQFGLGIHTYAYHWALKISTSVMSPNCIPDSSYVFLISGLGL